MNGPNGVMENAANHAEEEYVLSTGKSNQTNLAVMGITTRTSLATKILVLVIFSINKENILLKLKHTLISFSQLPLGPMD